MFHFLEDGKTLDQMPLDWFYGPAGVLHIPKQAGAQITVDDFLPFDPLLTPRAKIIYDTGWQRQFGQDHSFTELPSMPLKAARYIASKESRLLGMDTPTLSRDPDEVHHILLGQEVVIVESLANLDHVPDEFMFMGFPLNIVGRDGSPISTTARIE